jgi:uncharacterized protein YprB with RNaseH-like and TPR domain
MFFEKKEIEKFLYFDIETAGLYSTFEELQYENPRLALLWSKRAKWLREAYATSNSGKTDSELYLEKASLHPEFGRVVCVSFGNMQEDGTMRLKSFCGSDEFDILIKSNKVFANAKAKGWKLCGHTIKNFDVPFLGKRMLINKINPSQNLVVWNIKPWDMPFLDIAEVFAFGSWQQGFTGLDLMSCVLGIQSPKDEIDGSKVHKTFWEDKNYSLIETYCEKDVKTLGEILKTFSTDLVS